MFRRHSVVLTRCSSKTSLVRSTRSPIISFPTSSSSVWPIPRLPAPIYRTPYRPFLTSTSYNSPTTDPNSPSNSTPPTPLPPPPNFDEGEPAWTSTHPSKLPQEFGSNQYMPVDDHLKEHLRGLLWQFRAPVRYAFAYGSGVFSQGSSSPSGGRRPMIDLIFGVTYSQHWHSINLAQHPNHYSFLGSLGSRVLSKVQDDWGAGVYFNPYVEVNGTLIKYGIVNIDTLTRDLSTWDTLYLAGRLHKPVKIIRDHPSVRYSIQINLLSALRTALLLLPESFSEHHLYSTIANISYTGDPRMHLFTENPNKVSNIVANQLHNFRRLYAPIIEVIPNLDFASGKAGKWDESPLDTKLVQDMSPIKRGNMVRRLPPAFRDKLYFQYQSRYKIPRGEFQKMVGTTEDQERAAKRFGGEFEQRIAMDDRDRLAKEVGKAIRKTIKWPSTSQSVKGVMTAGVGRSSKYLGEKVGKWKEARKSRAASEHAGERK